ncbi:MAG: right-handed parallel beta-helix repeat-containing protein [Polyangiales bacterium]
MRKPLLTFFTSLPLLVAIAPASAWAVTLTVGPGRMYATPSAAAAAARDGDVVEIAAGTYRDVAIWRASNLTIRGVGGLAHLDAAGLTIPNGKAIWVIQGQNTTVERVEFSGARVPDRNGAGIRQEGAGLTLRGCFFHDNEDGILAGANAASDVVIESTEFARNGYGDGQSHNLYINQVRSLTMRGCYSHDARVGHLVKSRALATYLLYNRLTGEAGTSSYEVDLPNGGLAVLVGNVIEQGPATDNSLMVSYAAEGASNPVQRLYLAHNTLVNDRPVGNFVRLYGTPTAVLVNNLFLGSGAQVMGTATSTGNLAATASWFVAPSRYDYRLAAGAGAIDRGAPVGPTPDGSAVGLAPTSQYAHPTSVAARVTTGTAADVGAFEFGAPAAVDGGVADAAVDASADVPRDVTTDTPRDAGADGTTDTPRDAGADAPDVAAPEDAAPDASAPEDVALDAAAPEDAPPPDAAPEDAPPDVAATDVTSDGGAAPAPAEGCGCATPGSSRRARAPWLAALLLLVAARRRVRA